LADPLTRTRPHPRHLPNHVNHILAHGSRIGGRKAGPMKLIVQIPCYNEKATLAQTLAAIPRVMPGVDTVEILVVDDGSTDGTADEARRAGVHHLIRHTANRGLAEAFRTGIDACLGQGADIIVNTDGDNQYAGGSIPALIQPILEGRADVVIGDRQIAGNPHFARTKKWLQALGSTMVRRLSGTSVPDAVSGFRAISRSAALRLNIVSPFSYTIEMLIQAGKQRMAIVSVPVKTNPVIRHSRLFSNVPQFVLHSIATMLRIYTMYNPLRTFAYVGGALALVGVVPIVRFLFFYFSGNGTGHVQSLVLGGVFLMMGFVAVMVGVVADLIGFNRRLVEMTLQKVRDLELATQTVPLLREPSVEVSLAEHKAVPQTHPRLTAAESRQPHGR
jgi:glycosyltransferase involved in cell wall biosynthesis